MHRPAHILLAALSVMVVMVSSVALAHPGPPHIHLCGADGRDRLGDTHLPGGEALIVRKTYCRPVRRGDAIHVCTQSRW